MEFLLFSTHLLSLARSLLVWTVNLFRKEHQNKEDGKGVDPGNTHVLAEWWTLRILDK